MSLMMLLICMWIVTVSWSLCDGCGAEDFRTGPKCWWAKRYSYSLYTAGELTDRQIKQASEDGFATIVALYPVSETSYKNGEKYPNTEEESRIAQEQSGMSWMTLLEDDDWRTSDAYNRFEVAYNEMPKPILLHCLSSYSASFIAGLYVAAQYLKSLPTSKQSEYSGQKEFYRQAEIVGHDYTKEDVLRDLVADILKEPLMCHPRKPHISIPEWEQGHWHLKPVYLNIFIAGQLQTPHASRIAELGFTGIVNLREGVERIDGTPSQEEVTLLNIHDETGTYENGGRQSVEQLELTRIDEDKPNSYISHTSLLNYEARNHLEYGDGIGYNETMERIHLEEEHGFIYEHTPQAHNAPFNRDFWNLHKEVWLSMESEGPLIFHCRSGSRAANVALLVAAVRYNKSTLWMEERALIMGYPIEGHVISAWTHALLNFPDREIDDTPFQLHPDPQCPSAALPHMLNNDLYYLYVLCLFYFVLPMTSNVMTKILHTYEVRVVSLDVAVKCVEID